MKRILIIISIIFLASCASKFNAEKANTYVLSHPDRPDHIKEAISVGEVVPGMNEEEVTICMGEPDSITTTQSYPLNTKITGWSYFKTTQLKRTFIFFKDGVVARVNVSTQKGIRVVPYPGAPVNRGPITRPYPAGSFNSEPLITPVPRRGNINPRPIILSPPTVKKNCSK